MIGGAYLCFEGVEKILHKFIAHEEHEEKQPLMKPLKLKGQFVPILFFPLKLSLLHWAN